MTDDPHKETRINAIIQSLERMLSETRTARAHADAEAAVQAATLQHLLTTSREKLEVALQKIFALEKAVEEAKAPTEAQPAHVKPVANGAEQPRA